MATSEENDLIGYDPLEWMKADADKKEDHSVIDQADSGNTLEATSDNEIIMADDFSIENAGENATLDINEDELLTDGIDVKSDSALVEKMNDESIDSIATPEIATLGDTGELAAESPVSEETDGSQIDLDATLTIQNVVKLHEKLKDILAIHDQIEINASDVSSIDTATLQLLVSLKKDADKLQKKVTIIYPSPRFVESAQLLGLLDVLEVDGA